MLRKRIISIILAMAVVMSLSPAIVIFAGGNASQEPEYLFFEDFSSGVFPKEIISDRGNPQITVLNGEKLLMMQPSAAKDTSRVIVQSYDYDLGKKMPFTNTTAQKPEIVLEYDVKVAHANKYSYFAFRKDQSGYSNMIVYGNGSYGVPNGALWYLADPAVDTDALAGDSIGSWSDWHRISLVYSNTENTRKLYVDGKYIGTSTDTDSALANTWYSDGTIKWYFQQYGHTVTEAAYLDNIRVYNPATTFEAAARSEGYSLNEFYLDFNQSVYSLDQSMISVSGYTVKDVEVYDEGEQIYKVILNEKMTPGETVDVTLTDIASSIGKTLTDTVSFTVRDAIFWIDGPYLTDGTDEISSIPQSAYLKAEINNESGENVAGVVSAVFYDSEGKFIASSMASYPYSSQTTEVVTVNEGITVPASAESIGIYTLKGADNPVPVSSFAEFDGTDWNRQELTYKIPEYTLTPEISAVIKDDYSGITVTLDTKDTIERLVCFLVTRSGNTEYVKGAKTEGSVVTFDIPLNEANVGIYSIKAGIEGGGTVSVSPDIEYYSPSYISSILENKVNAVTATAVSVGEFITALGDYLGLDGEGISLLSDTTYTYERILNIRDIQTNSYETAVDDGKILTTDDFSDIYDTAVKMGRIYENKGTQTLISQSDDLEVDTQTKNIFKNVITGSARDYVADKLCGVTYPLPSNMTQDVKKYSILGGIYKATHWTTADNIIKTYGTELGIDLATYQALANPEYAMNNVTGIEYTDLITFASAANTAIANQFATENTPVILPPAPSYSGGGGGGGYAVAYPEEEEKEEEKTSVKSYTDVLNTHWFYSDVMWATENGWFIGTSETTFSPEDYLTWEQISIVLKRMGFTYNTERGNEPILRGDFAEVLYTFLADKEKYENKDKWIEGTKMFIGNDSGNMMFDTPLTRAQCCTLIRRIEDK